MYPVLFELPLFGGLKVYAYGVLVALGFLSGMLWVGREAKRLGEDPVRATDLVFYIIIAAIVGSRIAYVAISDSAQFFRDPLSFFRIWQGGLVFYGGLIGAAVFALWYTHRHRLSFWRMADIFAPGIPLGHFWGRLGCLMAGCCHGRPAPDDLWCAITFPVSEQGFAPAGVPLYPTQLMEAVGTLMVFGILVVLRKKKRFEGQVLALYLLLYAALRSGVEFYRGDAIRGFVFGGMMSTSQAISALLVLIALGIWLTQSKKLGAIARKLVAAMAFAGLVSGLACAKPLATASTYSMTPVTETFATTANAVYYGIRWALAARGYPVGFEDLHGGMVMTSWVPVKAASHYLQPFRSKDYGTTGAYHQLELRVSPGGEGTAVSITSRVKSLIRGLHSSGEEERAILQEIQHYLHGTDLQVTNIGVQ